MKIPKQIKIGAHVYKVLFPYAFHEEPNYVGQADHELGEIRLRMVETSGEERLNTRVLSTFIHEIIHCIDQNAGRDLFPEEEKEAKVSLLAEGLTAILIDNKLINPEIENEA